MKLRKPLLMGLLVGAISLMISCASTTSDISDAGISTKVKAKMATDSTVDASQIRVETVSRVVTLTGDINSQVAKDRALDLAKNTDGVVQVVDMIAVRTSETTGDAPDVNRTVGEAIDDAGITMSVKSQLLSDPDVKGMKIDVDTRDGVVFLTGKVGNQSEKEKAVQLAKATKGVRDVQTNLRIEKS